MATETRPEQFRRVHIEADRRTPFAIVRASGPARAPRGAPGVVETDEAIARRLDAETLRRNDGTLDDENPAAAEGPSDEQRGEAHAEVDPRRATVDHILNELTIAAVPAYLKAVDTLYIKHRAALDDDQIEEIDAAISAAKARIGKR